MRCEALADRLAGAVDDPRVLEPDQARHVAECLRCQADLAQYRRLRRVMAAMRTERLSVPAELAVEALGRLDEALGRRSRHRRTGRRAACLGGLAAVTAAGVGGVVVLASRRRPA
ncbi:MAG TPA: hypothetical protein VIY72_07890 [Acidimicrobiales bacterium]